MTATTPPPLPADLADGLKRLKMAAMRRLAAELLVTAKTQRWNPEEFLRTLVEAEITSRDASNTAARRRAAAFPVAKTLEGFDVAASSIPPATFDYLANLVKAGHAVRAYDVARQIHFDGAQYRRDIGHRAVV